MKPSTYQERQRTDGKWEATVDGKTWHRLLPMSFTAENAQKCFDGQKTQTRRLLNPQPPEGFNRVTCLPASGETCFSNTAGKSWPVNRTDRFKWLLPRYRVGDVLWVQEPWRTHRFQDKRKPIDLPDNVAIKYEGQPTHDLLGSDAGKLRPAMFLQRRFARPARYQVTAVRCERVNDISGKDIWAEGMTRAQYEAAAGDLAWWRQLWNSINTEPGTRFEDGPWTFPYTFRRVR